MERKINYPSEAYFFVWEDFKGVPHDYPSYGDGTTGFDTIEKCLGEMREFIDKHKNEISKIRGPYLGVYD